MSAAHALELGRWQDVLTVFALLMTRMLVAFAVIPLFVGGVPWLVRVTFVAGLAFSLLPLAYADPALAALSANNLIPFALKEAGIGLVLGLVSSIGFWALYAAGVVIEYQAGLTMANTIDPLRGQSDSLVGGIFMQLFTILFLLTGGLLSLIGMLFESYRVWPLASMTPLIGSAQLITVAMQGLEGLIVLAVKVAAPFVILMLAVESSIGYLSRFAPQLNVFFLSLPIKVMVFTGLLLLYGAVMSGT